MSPSAQHRNWSCLALLATAVQLTPAGSSMRCTDLLQVGDSLTLADSNMALTLLEAFSSLIGHQEQRQLHSVTRWLATCMEHPALAGAAGEYAALICPLLPPVSVRWAVHGSRHGPAAHGSVACKAVASDLPGSCPAPHILTSLSTGSYLLHLMPPGEFKLCSKAVGWTIQGATKKPAVPRQNGLQHQNAGAGSDDEDTGSPTATENGPAVQPVSRQAVTEAMQRAGSGPTDGAAPAGGSGTGASTGGTGEEAEDPLKKAKKVWDDTARLVKNRIACSILRPGQQHSCACTVQEFLLASIGLRRICCEVRRGERSASRRKEYELSMSCQLILS